MLDTMAEGVLILDDRERVVLANAAFERAVGVPFEQLMGKRASQIPGLASYAPTVEFPWQRSVTDGESMRGVEIRLDRSEGESHVFMVNASPILGSDGTQRGSLATFDDVTAIERKNRRLQEMVRELDDARRKVQQQNEELTFLAMRDGLTSCLNRRALFERLDEQWSVVRRYDSALACIMLDIDHFKSINDQHGHAAGDQVLARIGKVLKETTRGSDLVGRYGGEEFCIILPRSDLAQTAAVAEKLRRAVAHEVIGGLSVTASLGVLRDGARCPGAAAADRPGGQGALRGQERRPEPCGLLERYGGPGGGRLRPRADEGEASDPERAEPDPVPGGRGADVRAVPARCRHRGSLPPGRRRLHDRGPRPDVGR